MTWTRVLSSIADQKLVGLIPEYKSSQVFQILNKPGIADMTPYLPRIFMSIEEHVCFLQRLNKKEKTRYKYIQITEVNRMAFHQTLRMMSFPSSAPIRLFVVMVAAHFEAVAG